MRMISEYDFMLMTDITELLQQADELIFCKLAIYCKSL